MSSRIEKLRDRAEKKHQYWVKVSNDSDWLLDISHTEEEANNLASYFEGLTDAYNEALRDEHN